MLARDDCRNPARHLRRIKPLQSVGAYRCNRNTLWTEYHYRRSEHDRRGCITEDNAVLIAVVQENEGTAFDANFDKFNAEVTRFDAAEVAAEVAEAERVQEEMAREAKKQLREAKKRDRKQAIEERRNKIKAHFSEVKAKHKK